MSIQPENIKPSIAKDPTYRYVSVGFLVVASIALFLVMWFTRNNIPVKAPRTLTIYSFAAMETVMEEALIPAFQDHWYHKSDERVEFVTTFSGAGVITRQVMTQFPAEVVILSSELDARRLVGAGMLNTANWLDLSSKQKFCRTPIVMFVRNDPDTRIQEFGDINFDDMNVIIPDPLISGEGQMTALALYGSRVRRGEDHETALKYISDVFSGLRRNPSNSQDALEQFHAGIGDVLFNYEAARDFRSEGKDLFMIFPTSTIMVEPVAVAIDKNVAQDQEEVVNAFLDFLWSNKAQKLLSDFGFQTINTAEEPEFAPAPDHDIFTLNDLGTAIELNRRVIDPLLKIID